MKGEILAFPKINEFFTNFENLVIFFKEEFNKNGVKDWNKVKKILIKKVL